MQIPIHFLAWLSAAQIPLALLTKSSNFGTPRETKIPRFILAGSSAQLEIPTKDTFKEGMQKLI